MWAFTGGCHYDEECGGYENGCGYCKVLRSNKPNDISNKIFIRKQNTFQRIHNITTVGVSHWIRNCVRNSAIFNKKKVLTLPNMLDTNRFKPIDKGLARDILNLPQNKKLILYGAIEPTGDPRKGFKELIEATEKLSSGDIEFIVFGSSKPKNAPNIKYKTRYMGKLSDDVSLQVLYSAVDVMIVPSLQEAFGQTASEAMSCGTPTVAFAHTGLLDIIDHKVNGYLAKLFDTTDLANGIDWVINSTRYDELCYNAREKVLKEFDSVVVAKKYIKLYEEIISDIK